MTLKIRYNHIICLLALMTLPAWCLANKQTWFETGNQQYARGQYNAAITSYQHLLSAGSQSAELYYNLGNAYYKSNENAQAILYYEKAHKLSPGDEDININLEFARLKTVDKIEQAPKFFLARWWNGFILSISLHTLAILSIVFFVLGAGALIIYLFAGSVGVKKASFYTGLGLFGAGLIFILMANRQIVYFNNHREAVIFSGSVTIKGGPSNAAKNLFVLHDGTKVSVLETNNGWLKIRLPNGSEGWIANTDVKEI